MSFQTDLPDTGAIEVLKANRMADGKALEYAPLNSINRLEKEWTENMSNL